MMLSNIQFVENVNIVCAYLQIYQCMCVCVCGVCVCARAKNTDTFNASGIECVAIPVYR